jgi:hypothetical protein
MSSIIATLESHKDDDGSFYAKGVNVFRSPIVRIVSEGLSSPSIGVTMGWCIAEAATEQAAQAISEALNVKFADEIEGVRQSIKATLSGVVA